ncbi:MAG: TylF/MycF family methyltransferase [Cyclobacteriaceae bacterium]|nr:TylF/MycF family methyltransferase [Cyclobacteriaceae bacterium]
MSKLVNSATFRATHALEKMRDKKYLEIYQRMKTQTMVYPDVYIANLKLAEKFSKIEGDVVECGVWKGGMIGGIAALLGSSRTYHLFDSFEGLPAPKEVDGQSAINWSKNTEGAEYYDNCTAAVSDAETSMQLANVSNYRIYKGYFENTLKNLDPSVRIALLRLDGDWYDSTIVCLRTLFDAVVPGGGVLIDDYYAWDGCARAVHDFVKEREEVVRLHQFDNRVCYLIKNG